MRIGILGGTFNPIHLGHLHLALDVRSLLSLDEILFIPAGNPPHKTDEKLASPSDRFEMVRLAILPYPFFKISDIEIKRVEKSYTIDTIRELTKQSPEDTFFFIIGLDAFMEIESWRSPRELLQSVRFVVVSRPEFQFSRLKQLLFFKECSPEILRKLDQQAHARADLQLDDFAAMTLLHIDPKPISASEIRETLKKGENIPEPVKSFIIKKKLY
ncbi:MAG: nicotinate (nicotinamide) nucleotide adenylyltransferase [Nitrospirae bacterium]|nr:nicotinate (nicotinamide) nucleotide adenylyltransferase [Nitrospirota bacterium]